MLTSGIADADKIYAAAVQFEKEVLPNAMKEIMEPVENFFYNLGNEVISRCQGLANEGSENEAVQELLNQLENTKQMIKQFDDPEIAEEMAYWLHRLSVIGDKYNAAEGIVFNYRGKTMKLTGSFAALNRAINLRLKVQRKQKNQA
jgi:transcriptional regulator of heat shock response